MPPARHPECATVRLARGIHGYTRPFSRLLLFCLLILSATPTLAQYGQPITEQEKAGYWRAGPLRLTPLIELRNAGVDSNSFLTSAAEVSETEVVVRGGLKAIVPVGRRLRVRGDGWLDYSFFSEATEPRALYPGGELRAELDISRLTFFGDGGHLTVRERYTSDIDTRIERSEDWLNGGVQIQVTTLFGVDFGAEERRFRYSPGPDDPAGERIKLQLDHDSTSYRGRLRYSITPLTTFLVAAEQIEDTFLYEDPSRETTKSYRYLAGFEFGQKAVINGRFLAGVRDIPAPRAGSVAPYTGPAIEGSLRIPLFEQRLRLSGLFNRDVYYSASTALFEGQVFRNTYVYSIWQFTLEFDLPLSLTGRAIAGWQSATYQVPILVGGVDTVRDDRVRSVGGSLLRRLGRHSRLGFAAVHTARESNIPGQDYSRWQFGIAGEFLP